MEDNKGLSDAEAMDRIAELMSGSEYDLDNLDAVVEVVRATGRNVSDIEA